MDPWRWRWNATIRSPWTGRWWGGNWASGPWRWYPLGRRRHPPSLGPRRSGVRGTAAAAVHAWTSRARRPRIWRKPCRSSWFWVLAVRGMIRNRHLARSIAEAGWSAFRRLLEYQTTCSGCRLVVAPRLCAATKTCSACGHVKSDIPLSECVCPCAVWGPRIERDLNAARNPASPVAGSSVERKALAMSTAW